MRASAGLTQPHLPVSGPYGGSSLSLEPCPTSESSCERRFFRVPLYFSCFLKSPAAGAVDPIVRNGSAAPLRVLVAEDDAATARVLVWVLAQAGYDVEMALSGRATLDQLSASRYDVLICDWTMPDIDGVSIVRQVRQHTAAQPLIVLIAGTERPGAKEQALRVGADAYLAKPFEPVVLIDAIFQRLRTPRSEPARAPQPPRRCPFGRCPHRCRRTWSPSARPLRFRMTAPRRPTSKPRWPLPRRYEVRSRQGCRVT